MVRNVSHWHGQTVRELIFHKLVEADVCLFIERQELQLGLFGYLVR